MKPVTTNAFRYGEKYKINIVIDHDQLHDIEALAEEKRTNRSAVIREAIDYFLKVQREKQAA